MVNNYKDYYYVQVRLRSSGCTRVQEEFRTVSLEIDWFVFETSRVLENLKLETWNLKLEQEHET